ncbi:MAG: helix-turn-helix domain-containing protein [Sulfurovaceae bacterium]
MSKNIVEKRYYRVQEAATYLGVCKGTIWNWAKEGRFTIQQLGPKVSAIDKIELDALPKKKLKE